jgi:hypothetical protein
LAPLSWMMSSNSLTTGVICTKCIILNYIDTFHGMEGFVSTLERLPMDDYHKFRCAHEIQIEEWR